MTAKNRITRGKTVQSNKKHETIHYIEKGNVKAVKVTQNFPTRLPET